MKTVACFIVLIVACLAAAAPTSKPAKMKWVLKEGAPTELQYVFDNQSKWREARISELEKWIDFREQMIKQMKNSDSKDKAEAIKKFKADIEVAKSEIGQIKGDEIIVITGVPPKKVGECGRINQIVVDQVVDESNAIVDVIYFIEVIATRGRGNNQTHHVRSQAAQFPAWMTECDASNWTDGQDFSPGSVFWYCSGTHKYDTADGGTRTLPELRPFTMDSFERVPAE